MPRFADITRVHLLLDSFEILKPVKMNGGDSERYSWVV
jgi:hypothetical protein